MDTSSAGAAGWQVVAGSASAPAELEALLRDESGFVFSTPDAAASRLYEVPFDGGPRAVTPVADARERFVAWVD